MFIVLMCAGKKTAIQFFLAGVPHILFNASFSRTGRALTLAGQIHLATFHVFRKQAICFTACRYSKLSLSLQTESLQ